MSLRIGIIKGSALFTPPIYAIGIQLFLLEGLSDAPSLFRCQGNCKGESRSVDFLKQINAFQSDTAPLHGD